MELLLFERNYKLRNLLGYILVTVENVDINVGGHEGSQNSTIQNVINILRLY